MGQADVVLGVGTRMLIQLRQWGIDEKLASHSHRRRSGGARRVCTSRPSALIGDAGANSKRLLDDAAAHNIRARVAHRRDAGAPSRLDKRLEQARRRSSAILAAIRAELPEDGILVDEVTQVGFAARLAFPVYRPRTFLSPGYQDNLGWGFATALGVQDARRDVPVVSISGDGGFMFTANEMATAVRHRIPLTAIVFNDGAFGNVRRIQQERFGNRLIASDLANPDFVRFAESFGAAGERAATPTNCALRCGERWRAATARP